MNGLSPGTATISARLVNVNSGAQSATLTVNGPQIFLSTPTDPPNPPGGPATSTHVGQPDWGCGSFSQNAPGPWTVVINYGDGGGNENTPYTASGPCGGGPGTQGVFSFNHAYTSPTTYFVTVTVSNNTSHESTTRSFHVEVQEDNGGGGDECVPIVSNILVNGVVPFDGVQVAVFDRVTGDFLGGGELPFGHFDDLAFPAGQFRIEFSVPAGYMVTPSTFIVDAVCDVEVQLNATVQAIPTVPPTISLALSPDVIWPPNNQMVSVTATINASSPDGHATTVELVSITSSVPAAGDIAGASVGTDDRGFEVRAKKDRTYTVTYRATDSVTGLSATATATVVVPHDRGQ